MTYAEMEAELFARARSGMKLGLERMERALAALDHPERVAPAFHVAGTNGKGSVCAFLDAACRAAGLRTALYTSPHLEHFGERFQIDGVQATEAELLSLYIELENRIPWALHGLDSLTFFELVTLLAFLFFARSRVDVMVIEVGLGGRLDATNVITPIVSCITPVGIDHTEYLGDTLTAIAREKAGILKRGVPGVIAMQPLEARQAIDSEAAGIGVQLLHEGDDFRFDEVMSFSSSGKTMSDLRLSLRGAHQRSNAAVALQALEMARARGLAVPQAAVREGLRRAKWPGRLETVQLNPEVVLDGAHNPAAAVVLAAALRDLYPAHRRHLVIGMLADKDAGPVIATLAPLAATLTFTSPTSPRASPAESLARLAAGHPRLAVVPNPMAALAHAKAQTAPEDVVVVAGSLYLVGEIRAALKGGRVSGPTDSLRAAV